MLYFSPPDIDECNENGRICLNGQCINKPGSYRCVCNRGYQLSPDGAFCVGKYKIISGYHVVTGGIWILQGSTIGNKLVV